MGVDNNVIKKRYTMFSRPNVAWMDEDIERMPDGQGKYKLLCAIFFKKKMTYGNMYVFAYAMHKNRFKDNERILKEKILKDLALIYYYNNNRLPEGFKTIEKEKE